MEFQNFLFSVLSLTYIFIIYHALLCSNSQGYDHVSGHLCSTDCSQWQYIFHLSTPILTDTCLSILVGNFVYFTVLDYTEHSHTTVGNETLPLTVDNAEFSCKFFRTY